MFNHARPLTVSFTAALMLLALTNQASAGLIDGLQLYYSFDNDALTPGGINDLSSNGRNGSPIAVADGTLGYSFSTDVPSAVGGGNSLRADGGDEVHADTPTNYSGVLGSNSRTIASWVKVDPNVGDGQNIHIVEWGTNSAGNRWSLRREQNNTNGEQQGGIRTEIQTDFRTTASGGPSLNDDAWHHVATVFDNAGGTKLEQVTMYVDGVAFDTSEYLDGSASVDIATSGTGPVLIGGSVLSDRRWNGWLDEVGIWSRPLTPTEIGQLAAGATIPEPTTLCLAAVGLLELRRRRRT